jgi:hypothetical protein
MARLLLLLLPLVCAGPAFADDTLRPGQGRDTAEAYCAMCHSLGYIQMNSPFMSADVWKAEVTKMRMAFGAPIDDETAAEIGRYLAAQYAKP